MFALLNVSLNSGPWFVLSRRYYGYRGNQWGWRLVAVGLMLGVPVFHFRQWFAKTNLSNEASQLLRGWWISVRDYGDQSRSGLKFVLKVQKHIQRWVMARGAAPLPLQLTPLTVIQRFKKKKYCWRKRRQSKEPLSRGLCREPGAYHQWFRSLLSITKELHAVSSQLQSHCADTSAATVSTAMRTLLASPLTNRANWPIHSMCLNCNYLQ